MNKFHSKNITLDVAHTEIINRFKKYEEQLIPKYKLEIEKLEKILNNNNNNNNIKKKSTLNRKNNHNFINKNENIETKIQDLKNKIFKMEKEKKNYYLNNSKYIFDYFETKKKINDNENENENESENNILNKYFGNDDAYNNKLNSFFLIDNSNDVLINNNDDNLIKNTNIDKYFYNIDNYSLNFENFCYVSDICKYCKKGELVYVESEGASICSNCSKTIKYLIENEKPSYKEPPKEVCFYAYKRINHLREILAQFQAKESTNIPNEVYENIKAQIKKERIEIKDLTNKKTKEILKNLGYNKYYEHIPYIKDKLGIKPPIMSQDLEETLCNLFMEIQKPYSKYCPKDRVNFLNYYYTLYKLCEILNEKKFLPFFPMLKDREKRIEQDQIWKKICDDLGWTFIPTP
jgi:hypothetical protein